jgi:hypothetical protein
MSGSIKRTVAVLTAVLAAAGPAAAAGKRADFIDGVYAKEGLCEKVAAVEAGGPKNVETVTETLSPEGFRSWEGGCDFDAITEKEKGRTYEARMTCNEGAQEWIETNQFILDPADATITVWIEGEKHLFVKCGSDKGK